MVRPSRGDGAGLAKDPFADRRDEPALLGGGHESPRRQQPMFGVLPAQQRLERADSIIHQIDQRLKRQAKLALEQGVAESGLRVALLLESRVQAFFIKMICAPTFAFGPIHRQVRAPHQRFAVGAIDRSDGDADARPDKDAMALYVVRLGDLPHYPFGKAGRVFRLVEPTCQNGELVAAETSDNVAFAQTVGQLLAYFLQDGVARGMPERIVDALEIVEINVKDADRLTVSGARLDLLEARPKGIAVGQIGQSVMAGQMSDARLVATLFGHV